MSRHEAGETIDVWVVTVDHQWPLNVYTIENHAIYRYKQERKTQGAAKDKVHIWKGQLTIDCELRLVEEEPRLEHKNG